MLFYAAYYTHILHTSHLSIYIYTCSDLSEVEEMLGAISEKSKRVINKQQQQVDRRSTKAPHLLSRSGTFNILPKTGSGPLTSSESLAGKEDKEVDLSGLSDARPMVLAMRARAMEEGYDGM